MNQRPLHGSKALLLLLGCFLAALHSPVAKAQIDTPPSARPGDPQAGLISPGWAPFGSVINQQRIPGYHRATYLIGTAGPLTRDGITEAKRVGFVAILDLQSSSEGSRSERVIAEYAHLGYFNLPISTEVPSPQQMQEFASIVQNQRNLPILVHAESIDKVGAVWAFYRAALGVPPAIAVVDGITAGLGQRLPAVRAAFGLTDQP